LDVVVVVRGALAVGSGLDDLRSLAAL
jgi:hypothetical protein